jgi:SnoaL-like polyketide cyclase
MWQCKSVGCSHSSLLLPLLRFTRSAPWPWPCTTWSPPAPHSPGYHLNSSFTIIEDQIAEGDTVVTRWTGTGTHQGDLLGMAPTGKPAKVMGIWIHRLAGGKIVESWNVWDTLGMLQQLGVIPAPGSAGS